MITIVFCVCRTVNDSLRESKISNIRQIRKVVFISKTQFLGQIWAKIGQNLGLDILIEPKITC